MKTLITGHGSDVGRAIGRRRQALGDEVVFTSRAPDDDPTIYPFDLDAPEQADRLAACLDSGIDALVLSAATPVIEPRPLDAWSFAEARAYVRANVEGNLWLVHRALPAMRRRKFGRIVFVSSVSAHAGTAGYGPYCAAKAALEGLMFNVAVEFASENIFANVLRLGLIKTTRTERFWSRPGYERLVGKMIPAAKMGMPDQVAEATDALLSPTAYVNGAVLEVAGGLPRTRGTR